jgi:hypothetical protein
MALRVAGSWTGWFGDTVVKLTDGSVWEQIEYYYQYRYSYRPEVSISSNRMLVSGMNRAVRVRRLR